MYGLHVFRCQVPRNVANIMFVSEDRPSVKRHPFGWRRNFRTLTFKKKEGTEKKVETFLGCFSGTIVAMRQSRPISLREVEKVLIALVADSLSFRAIQANTKNAGYAGGRPHSYAYLKLQMPHLMRIALIIKSDSFAADMLEIKFVRHCVRGHSSQSTLKEI